MRKVVPLLLLFWSLPVAGELRAAAIQFPRGSGAWVVATPETNLEKRTVDRLTTYLEQVLTEPAQLVGSLEAVPEGVPCLILAAEAGGLPSAISVPTGSPESFALITSEQGRRPVVWAVGATDLGLKRAVQRLVMASEQTAEALVIPDLQLSERPWILEREWALCPWVAEYVRGVFVNPYADRRLNIWLYGDEQMSRYVEMFDWFGFSGCQLLETAYSYSVFGSPEAFQQRQKLIAEQVKENGQNVSLWVWAAQFDGFGWRDPVVTYVPQEGKTAFEDPRVRRAFEKYYDHYVELAPYVDRVIGHFYDPGQLPEHSDVFQYMRLLEGKSKARNPRLTMAIDSWAKGPEYLTELVENGFDDYLLLEISMPSFLQPPERAELHREARRLGLQLGVWGWYTTEYETDQLASMYVNAQLLKDFYNQVRDGAFQIHPLIYWSEMEAHHLNNIYSMYAAAQLLWNPDRDPDDILSELSEAIWGPRNGPKVLEALLLIQEMRSGPRWDTYWWRQPGYRLGSEDPEMDLKRCEAVLGAFRRLEADEPFVTKLPLPVSPSTLVELMLPHLRQIRAFATFRVAAEEMRQAARDGTPKVELRQKLIEAWIPIPEYDTWIGTFGQPEARRQEQMVLELCKEFGITVPFPAWVRYRDADRLLQRLQNMQSMKSEPLKFGLEQVGGFFWPEEKLLDCLQKLVDDGWVRRVEPNLYQLTHGFLDAKD